MSVRASIFSGNVPCTIKKDGIVLYFEYEETEAVVHQLAAERCVSAEEAIRIAV